MKLLIFSVCRSCT